VLGRAGGSTLSVEEDQPASWSSRIGRAVDDLGGQVKGVVDSAATAVDGAARDATSTLGVAKTRASFGMRDLAVGALSCVTSPIVRRAHAARTVLSSAVSGSAEALLWGILIPPAIPVMLAMSLLDSVESYDQGLEEADRQEADRRLDRQIKREKDLQMALAAYGRSIPRVCVETDCLQVSISTDTGQGEGVILRGLHAGRALREIPPADMEVMARTAPDRDTGEILARWHRASNSTT
jgi:hypothetical protein